MQFAGFLEVRGKTIRVLVRPNFSHQGRSQYVSLKMRTTGKLGKYMQAESEYLEQSEDDLTNLLNGKVIKI